MSIWSGYIINEKEYLIEVLGKEAYDLLPKDKDIEWEIHTISGPPVEMTDLDFNIFIDNMKKRLCELEK